MNASSISRWLALAAGFVLLFMSSSARSVDIGCLVLDEQVTILYICTNRCVVERMPGGRVTVRDCCGGSARVVIQRTAQQACVEV